MGLLFASQLGTQGDVFQSGDMDRSLMGSEQRHVYIVDKLDPVAEDKQTGILNRLH